MLPANQGIISTEQNTMNRQVEMGKVTVYHMINQAQNVMPEIGSPFSKAGCHGVSLEKIQPFF